MYPMDPPDPKTLSNRSTTLDPNWSPDVKGQSEGSQLDFFFLFYFLPESDSSGSWIEWVYILPSLDSYHQLEYLKLM